MVHVVVVVKLCSSLAILAEFIIALADKHSKFEKFKSALEKNGAQFPVCVVCVCVCVCCVCVCVCVLCVCVCDCVHICLSFSQDSFTSNLLHIIQTMRPHTSKGI